MGKVMCMVHDLGVFQDFALIINYNCSMVGNIINKFLNPMTIISI